MATVTTAATAAVDELKNLNELVAVCGAISGSNERCEAFREKGQPIKALLAQIYDPFQKFHVTSKNILKHEKTLKKMKDSEYQGFRSCDSLSHLLHLLSDEDISGHDALKTCVVFIQRHESYRDVILKALNKDLKIRVGLKMVLKAFPLLVSVFSCALSLPMEKHMKFFEEQRDHWWLSRKLDGCRCIFICEDGKATAYSRSGHVYPYHIEGLSHFIKKFSSLTGVIDGEIGVVGADNLEHFNVANSLMNPNATENRSKKNLQMPKGCYLCYFAFDFIPIKTFKAGVGGPTWSDRQKLLKSEVPFDNSIRLLEQRPCSDMDVMWAEAESKGWEGLMLRLDTHYEGKKSRKMLKRKRQDDSEFVIEEATASEQLIPGTTDSTLALEHVGIQYKGCRVFVGSGWEWEDRLKYGTNPEQLVGHHVTVKHYGESRNRDGGYSLRHPSVKAMWGPDGRTH